MKDFRDLLGNAEFQRFLTFRLGSASELEYHFQLARDLGYFAEGGLPESEWWWN
jgi:four helix bundle protein